MILNNLLKKSFLKTAWGLGALLVGLFLFTFVDIAKADARYISRAEWCNHSVDCDANRTWKPQYEYAPHVMVHHTGAGDGYGDTISKVRAIWSFHTYYVKNPDGSVGWGDIGYNYLIDAYGNVFEGRFGGEDVIGAHGNTYNRGSIGISILGTYTNYDISVAARDSLLELMAEKLGKKGLEPNSSAYYPSRWSSAGTPAPDAWGRYGVIAPRIDGHRTFNPTGCPGNAFYSTFPNLRIWASQRAVKYSKPWTILGSAVYDNNLSAPIDYTKMYTGQTAIAVLIIRNNTNYTWTNSGPNAILLGTKSPQDSSSPIANNWITPWRATTMLEPSVAPGQSATFHYGVKAPNSLGSWRTYLAPVIEGVTWLNHYGYNIPITVTSTAPAEPATGFKGEVISNNLPAEMITEAVYNAEIKIKNTGGIAWTNSGSNPVTLGTSNPIDRHSPFYVLGNWLNAGRPAKLLESSVATGQIGTFRFQFKAPITPGNYTENFNIVREGDQWGNLNISKTINVKGTFKAEVQSFVPQENVLQGSEKIVTLSFKNTGTATWLRGNTNLGTANPYDRLSPLANQSWLNGGRPAKLNEDQVLPGNIGTFTFSVNTSRSGNFNESFSPVVEGVMWMPSVVSIRFVISPPTYSYQFISQAASKNLANLSFGDRAELTLKVKNTGNVSWKNSGLNPVTLGASNPRDRISPFFTSGNWLNAARPAKLAETEVLPGEDGTFVWTINAPKNSGEYREFYTPVVEGKQWMADATFNYYIKVDNKVSYQFISQAASKNLANLLPGEEASLGLTVKNTGNITWKKSGPNTVNLGTSNPNDRSSPVYHSSWLNAGRPTSFGQAEVKPGEIATFEWIIKASSVPGTNLREYYNLVMEGFTWLPATNFNYYIAVSGNFIDVSSSSTYDFNLADGQNITTFSGNSLTSVYYQSGIYTVRNGSFVHQTNSVPRFYPSNGLITLPRYTDLAYNGSNDNIFRGIMEIRYSGVSNKLWAISEEWVEDYLKGIAESSVSSPSEHLKVMSSVARTYAYYHLLRDGKHVGEPFHLKNSRNGNGNDQVFKGYGLEARFPQLATAVNATANQTVNYNNSPILAAYSRGYAPRTLGATEAGWVHQPYLISVADPLGATDLPCGQGGNHCVGLSASGSVGYALQGHNYTSILLYYYQGAVMGSVSPNIIRVAIYGI